MTPEETKAFEEKIRAYVGRELGAPKRGKDDVNAAMIRHWAEVLGDENPVYTDAEYAAKSSKGGLIAPAHMLQIWSMEGYPMCQTPAQDLQRELHNVFDAHGFTGVLGTNTNSEYFRDLRPGDQVFAQTIISSISEQKATQRGIGYFIETTTSFTDQNKTEIGRQVFRCLKFIPQADQAPAAASEGDSAPAAPTRIASPRGHDNAWWWEAVDSGRLLIQRCKSCNTLRHPPRPMCGECQSTEWDSIESTLDGEIISYTQMHYPKFPGYPYPLICAVIKLNEGTNLVSNLVGCEPEAIKIGMKVKGKVEQVDEKTWLPQFYLA
ncbi:MAG: bifunctional MaoC family dehydratase/OB-fold nucleic acid binding domain-containing protein [Sterolibacterium sp.]|jgi:uncharacterized OB-fold protein/acyl dehydratase|nr:bifunctional MaoC family dehydratase/OB-fold nucleic acid binding domain-containing protein [Sterolibacterium sp.]